MNFDELRQALVNRLDEADRGDRGWWLVTRVRLTSAKIVEIARYLHGAGAATDLSLTEQHFIEIGKIVGIESDPIKNIKRHYFLAMDQPLGILRRAKAPSWDTVRLTAIGLELATSDDPISLFEQQLSHIQFCREPWYSEARRQQYDEFDVRPYPTSLRVMGSCGGHIDIDEFDLFVSRIRTEGEIDWAIRMILAFRECNADQRRLLLKEVAVRVPAEGKGKAEDKAYRNWRDIARHTFSLLSLGSSAERVGNVLWLARELFGDAGENVAASPGSGLIGAFRSIRDQPVKEAIAGALINRVPIRQPRRARLLIPEGAAPEELLVPPGASSINGGFEAELLVAKAFRAAGWEVVYYTRKRGYGFDLWVRRDEQAFVVEVKSFVGDGGTVVLTETEHRAARHHGNNYLLVVVERAMVDPEIHVVQDPASQLQRIAVNASQFAIARSAWRTIGKPLSP